MLDDHARRASDTYNAASDHYDAEPLGFWARVGQRTVERLGLRSGAAVLDAPCGSGASALVAAARIGPDGHVLAIDLAERLLALGRAKAAAARLANIEFRTGDMRAPGAADASFDAVVCVFGIFFVDDMDAQVRRLWRLLRPGGAIAITTWGSGMFAPGDAAFWAAIAAVRPDLVRGYNPWDALVNENAVRDLFARAGAAVPRIVVRGGPTAPAQSRGLLGDRARLRLPRHPRGTRSERTRRGPYEDYRFHDRRSGRAHPRHLRNRHEASHVELEWELRCPSRFGAKTTTACNAAPQREILGPTSPYREASGAFASLRASRPRTPFPVVVS